VKADGDNVVGAGKGIGYVAAVYLLPTGGGTTAAESIRLVRRVAEDAAAQVVVAGDFNARIGELRNLVGPEQAKMRRSKDKEVDTRGRKLMKTLGKTGLFVINGVGEEADFTCENNNKGRSVIDLIWVSASAKVGDCEEWSEASCCISDHSMIAVEIEGQSEEPVVKKQRKTGWNKATKEWKEEGAQRWQRWKQENEQRSAEEMWKSWKQLFEEEATGLVGKKKARVEKHHEGVWSEHVQGLVSIKNQLRRSGKQSRRSAE